MGDTSGPRRSLGARTFCPDRLGADITRRYDFDGSNEIGVGGYGKVFLAKDREFSNRLVAIKKVIVMDSDPEKKKRIPQGEQDHEGA